jgi:hypothetical protein
MPEITIEMDGAASGTTISAEELVAEIVEAPDDNDDAPVSVGVELVGAMVPIVLFLAVAATYCTKYFFAWREKHNAQELLRAALERGDPLTRELLDRLVQPAAPKRNDLRRGLIAVGLGVALASFGFISGEPDAVRPMLAIGLLPLLLGLAYLMLWRLETRQKNDHKNGQDTGQR